VSGFAGVVFALSRSETIHLPETRLRLTILFGAGLSTGVISLVPQTLRGIHDDGERVGLFERHLAAARSDLDHAHLEACDARLRRVSRSHEAGDLHFSIHQRGGMLLQLGKIFLWQGFHAFFLGLSFTLLLAILMFFRIVAAELRE